MRLVFYNTLYFIDLYFGKRKPDAKVGLLLCVLEW
nr:MAG TPA: hypothetical protein [Caudoviricetes sp.]